MKSTLVIDSVPVYHGFVLAVASFGNIAACRGCLLDASPLSR
jgi:hypothetical protein